MKTILPLKQYCTKLLLLSWLLILGITVKAQTVNVLSEGLKFINPQRQSGADLQEGATYLFTDVTTNVNAVLTIDSLVNGARVTAIDDNSNGAGYRDAFQPSIQSGGIIGQSYAVFTIKFYHANTTNPAILSNVNATAVDLDGNNMLKEFVKINAGPGSILNYLTTTIDISVIQLPTGEFIAQNILGVERNGIDTANFSNMFTYSHNNVSSLTIKYGSITANNSRSPRQFSMYMKGFTYPNTSTLPVKLVSFSATINDDEADLTWTTSSEKDVSHFSVEKSVDGQNFSQAGIVFAAGNSAAIVNYSFADKNLNTSPKGIIYYRLRSIDIDGSSELSAVRMITLGSHNKKATSILTYPNPVTNELHITIPTSWQGRKVTYELMDNNGRATKRKTVANASQTESIPVANLGRGFYIASVTCDDESAQQKVIKR